MGSQFVSPVPRPDTGGAVCAEGACVEGACVEGACAEGVCAEAGLVGAASAHVRSASWATRSKSCKPKTPSALTTSPGVRPRNSLPAVAGSRAIAPRI